MKTQVKGTQVSGRALKVGDTVRAADGTPHLDGRDRQLGTMLGVITKVLPGPLSGAPQGKVRVLWASGSEGSHDSCMVVKVPSP